MSVWKIKYVVYFHYLNVRGKISMERKEPSTSEVAHIGAELALFKGAICERAEISGAVLAPINFKVAPVFFKFTLHMVQFGPYNGVNSAPKLVPKTAPFQWGWIDPKQVPNWTHSFWPHFWGQISSFNFTVYGVAHCRYIVTTPFYTVLVFIVLLLSFLIFETFCFVLYLLY